MSSLTTTIARDLDALRGGMAGQIPDGDLLDTAGHPDLIGSLDTTVGEAGT